MPGKYISPADFGFYYLITRYYDPVVKRFISADHYVSTGQGFTGNNMFAYCNNNPVMLVDPTGEFPWLITIVLIAFTVAGAIIGANADEKLFDNSSQTSDPPKLNMNENQEPHSSDANDEKELTFSDRIINTLIGGAWGLVCGGALVATCGVFGSLYVGSATITINLFGVSGAQATAIGALAYNVLPMIIAPFFNIEAEPIELPN